MSTTRNLPPPAPPLIALTPGPGIQVTFQLVFVTTGKVIQCPKFRLQSGMAVTLSPVNGTAVNANPCSVAERAQLVGTSSARMLPAGSDVTIGWTCDNTAQIFAAGTAGDGLLVTVTQAAFG
jgi:hypothetical protein